MPPASGVQDRVPAVHGQRVDNPRPSAVTQSLLVTATLSAGAVHMRRSPSLAHGLLVLVFAALAALAAPPVARAAAPSADAQFEALGRRFVDEFGRYAPVYATALGDHRFDGELDDLSPAGRARTRGLDPGHPRAIAGDRPHPAVARQPGRCRDARQPAALQPVERADPAGQSLESARLHAARRPGAVRPAGARVRAAAGAPALADLAAGEAAHAARADPRQPGAGAGAFDPCRDGCPAEPGPAEPGR